jgi:hypothetical protein
MQYTLQLHPWDLSVIKLDLPVFDSIGASEIMAFSLTPTECSAVCETHCVPDHVIERRDGWRCISIVEAMDLTVVGVLAGITTALANAGINLFAFSTFDTDYILVPAKREADAVAALTAAGYAFAE